MEEVDLVTRGEKFMEKSMKNGFEGINSSVEEVIISNITSNIDELVQICQSDLTTEDDFRNIKSMKSKMFSKLACQILELKRKLNCNIPNSETEASFSIIENSQDEFGSDLASFLSGIDNPTSFLTELSTAVASEQSPEAVLDSIKSYIVKTNTFINEKQNIEASKIPDQTSLINELKETIKNLENENAFLEKELKDGEEFLTNCESRLIIPGLSSVQSSPQPLSQRFKCWFASMALMNAHIVKNNTEKYMFRVPMVLTILFLVLYVCL